MPKLIQQKPCPACGHHVAVAFFQPGDLPLTTLAWPTTAIEAEQLPKLPHNFVRCVDCGHIYNVRFDYADVPYSDKPNLMFNAGAIWSRHLSYICELLLERLPVTPTVVEIGCGNGQLLRALADARPGGRYIGFDPNATIETNDGAIEARVELFEPESHLAECRADLIISRHVLEHLMNPLGFLQALAFTSSWTGSATRLFLEVPCVDGVLGNGRTVDFFYEHNSHFTVESFSRMLKRCAAEVEFVQTSYNDEVVFGLARFQHRPDQVRFADEAMKFQAQVACAGQQLARQLDDLAQRTTRLAIWGGTGKAAAFINQHGLDRHRFPLVVDSDRQKVGTHVPGTGQEIQAPDVLLEGPPNVILLATQWRAADIVWEIQQGGICVDQILVEHRGQLLDFFRGNHPYRDPECRIPEALRSDDEAGPTPNAPHTRLGGVILPELPIFANVPAESAPDSPAPDP